MSLLFRIAIKEKETENKGKKEVIIYQCQCGYTITSGFEGLLFSHLSVHRREARRLTSKMKEFFKS